LPDPRLGHGDWQHQLKKVEAFADHQAAAPAASAPVEIAVTTGGPL